MSDSESPEIRVRSDLRAGVWADHVDVFGDFAELTLDLAGWIRGRRIAESSSPAWRCRAGAY